MDSKLPLVAAIVAFGLALLTGLSASTNPLPAIPFALIALGAGVSILRGRVWGAYGFALYLVGEFILFPILLLRSQTLATSITSYMILGLVGGPLVSLFYLAGRSMSKSSMKPGSPLVWIFLTALTTLPFLFVQAFVLPTGSMENTIRTGEGILVRRFPHPVIARGEIVVHVYPIDRKQTFVKRVVGIPGDRIRIVQKQLLLNGAPQNESYAVHKTDYLDAYRDNFPGEPNTPLFLPAQEMLQRNVEGGEVVVPSGKLFVMGDNRDQSLDSRYWGFLDMDDVIGKPFLVYASPEKSRLFKRL